MRRHWPKTKLDEVLNPASREESVDASKEYRLLGVRLDGAGPFLRETVLGTQTAATKLFRVAGNDFIYSRLFACRGAFGVIPAALDGCYVSGEFPTFTTNAEKIDVNFLKYWFRLPHVIARVDEDCFGSTPLTRNRFKENFFLALEIPLPPICEQRRIVARIEELASSVAQAMSLGTENVRSIEQLLICIAHRKDLNEQEKQRQGWRRVLLEQVIAFVDDSVSVNATDSYPNLGIYSFGRGLFSKPPIGGLNTSAKSLRRVRKGQFIYSRLFAFEGAYGMVTDEFEGFFVSQEYPTFDCHPQHIRAEFLWAYFKAPSVWKNVGVGSKGLGHRRQRVQPDKILAHEVWLPPMGWQNKIADITRQVDALKRLQAEIAAELDALLPSILDKAFKGEF